MHNEALKLGTSQLCVHGNQNEKLTREETKNKTWLMHGAKSAKAVRRILTSYYYYYCILVITLYLFSPLTPAQDDELKVQARAMPPMSGSTRGPSDSAVMDAFCHIQSSVCVTCDAVCRCRVCTAVPPWPSAVADSTLPPPTPLTIAIMALQ